MALSPTGIFEVDGGHVSASDSLNAGYFNSTGSGAGTDYSILEPIACTDLAIDASDNTKVSSTSIGFTSAHARNGIRITAGTGFTTGLYEIVSVSAGVATLDRAAGTTSSTSGTARVGGPFASPGQAAALRVASNIVFIKYWSTGYVISSTANVSGGRINDTISHSSTAPGYWIGYNSNRVITNTDSDRPNLKVNANSVTAFSFAGTHIIARNLAISNNGSFTSCTGVSLTGTFNQVRLIKTSSINTGFLTSSSTGRIDLCESVSCSGGYSLVGPMPVTRSSSWSCSTGFSFASACWGSDLIAIGGITGFLITNNGSTIIRPTSYNCTTAGFQISSGFSNSSILFGLAYGCGINYNDLTSDGSLTYRLISCAGGAPGTSNYTFNSAAIDNFITLSANPFIDSASNDFRINNVTGGGALLRAAGGFVYPGSNFSSYPDVGAYQSNSQGPTGIYNIAY